ncbi:hypothetical protein HNP46_004669 [Pseudomonas nitritireducens]|uniref:Uncharacterized protein n=1 Tax=Pseudomonas nitroreducens TaxID=46680 RepID=A0A7W7KNX5_PSENT|nr:hypothetical protein [Pseudomonas nitritireducens]MBB4865768.1 hypothetical protein [Pseudomonas nitritireducens]
MSKIDNQKYVDVILESLRKIEDRGDIVITTTTPTSIARSIIHSLSEAFLGEAEESEAIIECDIPYLLEETSQKVSLFFSKDIARSREIVNAFYKSLLERLSMRQIAEMIWHETPSEIARLSYYSVELKREFDRDLVYLDWRKDFL